MTKFPCCADSSGSSDSAAAKARIAQREARLEFWTERAAAKEAAAAEKATQLAAERAALGLAGGYKVGDEVISKIDHGDYMSIGDKVSR